MKAILIPVKELSKAKQRLAAHFFPEQRIELADALWQDFFDVVAAVRGVDRIFVISAEPRVLQRARQFSWEVIPETRQTSETDSVDFASRVCAHFGVKALLRLPVDLPLVGPTDIEAIWRGLPVGPSTVIVPSRDGDGTNALLRTPPSLFPSHFGPGASPSIWVKRSSAAHASRFCGTTNWKRISTTTTTCVRCGGPWWRLREPAPGWSATDSASLWRARPALSAED